MEGPRYLVDRAAVVVGDAIACRLAELDSLPGVDQRLARPAQKPCQRGPSTETLDPRPFDRHGEPSQVPARPCQNPVRSNSISVIGGALGQPAARVSRRLHVVGPGRQRFGPGQERKLPIAIVQLEVVVGEPRPSSGP